MSTILLQGNIVQLQGLYPVLSKKVLEALYYLHSCGSWSSKSESAAIYYAKMYPDHVSSPFPSIPPLQLILLSHWHKYLLNEYPLGLLTPHLSSPLNDLLYWKH